MNEIKNLPKAYVTLITNNNYVNGAIVLGYSLRNYNTSHLIICLVTFEVDSVYLTQLSKIFDHVIEVPKIDSNDQKRLNLLGRPELGVTFSKLHVWNMTWLSQILFLDADTLVLKNIDHLFSQYGNTHFAACPDIGWPDCFNSGVFMCKPSNKIYTDLIQLSMSEGSFDGGDQGLLNAYFNSWSKDQNQRIPFTYNVTPNAVYSYAPAYQQYHNNISVLHFIGQSKPWNQVNTQVKSNDKEKPNITTHSNNLSHKWWDMFNNLPHELTKQTKTIPSLSSGMGDQQPTISNKEDLKVELKSEHNQTKDITPTDISNFSKHPFDNIFKNPKQEPPHISSLPQNYFVPLESPPKAQDDVPNLSSETYNSLDNYKILTPAHESSKDEPFPLFEAFKTHRPRSHSNIPSPRSLSSQFLTPDYSKQEQPSKTRGLEQKNLKKVSYSLPSTKDLTSNTFPQESDQLTDQSNIRFLGTKFNRVQEQPTVTTEGTFLTEYQVTVESDSPIDDNCLKFEPSLNIQDVNTLSSQTDNTYYSSTTED